MKILKRSLLVGYMGLLCSFLVISPVNAYIDPGTGSLIIQFIVGAIIGASVIIKIFWKKIKSIFIKKSK